MTEPKGNYPGGLLRPGQPLSEDPYRRALGFAPPASIEIAKGIKVKERKHYPDDSNSETQT